MKTLNDLQGLIFEAIKLESFNNFIIKHSVGYTLQPGGLISFDITYKSEDKKTVSKKIDFLFNPSNISVNEIQSYYWQLTLFLERHFK